jgi:WD40 repeat protein
LSLSAGSRYLAYGGTDQLVRICDLRRKEMVKTFKGHADTITSMTLSPDAKYVASGSECGDIIIHNFDTNSVAKKLQYSRHAIRSMQFSTKKKSLLATGSDDGSVIVWDVNNGRRVCSFLIQHSAPCIAVSFSARKDIFLVSAGADKKLYCYDIESQK